MLTTPLFKQGADVFDIGAHHGGTADKLFRYGAGRVISVEPLLANYLKLVEYAAKRAECAPRLFPVHGAVDDKDGIAVIHGCKEQDGLSTMHAKRWGRIYTDKTFGPGEMVATFTMENLVWCFGWPAFIKVDVEGHERNVILSLCDLARKAKEENKWTPIPLALEFHGATMEDTNHCLGLLAGIGYTCAHYVTEDIDLDTKPTRSIVEVKDELWNNLPGWGNITVR